MRAEKRTAQLTIRLPQTLRDQLETLARFERRTLSDMATLLIEEAIEERGGGTSR